MRRAFGSPGAGVCVGGLPGEAEGKRRAGSWQRGESQGGSGRGKLAKQVTVHRRLPRSQYRERTALP